MIAALLDRFKLYLGIAGIVAVMLSYAAVYDAGYRARATRDHSQWLQAQLDAATKDKERLELSAKLAADETRLLSQYRQDLQERVHALEADLANPPAEPAHPVTGPVGANSCPAPDSVYRATADDVRRLQQIRTPVRSRKPAARAGVQRRSGAAAESR